MRVAKQAGDTIVEALIATAIVGLTIGLAYGIATRSIRSARQAQERIEAVKIAETQIETMKAYASDDNSTNDEFFGNGNAFCLTAAGVLVRTGLTTVPDFGDDQLNATEYSENCRQGENQRYHVAVQRTDLNEGRYQFTVSVRWFSFGELDKEQVQILYRLHRQ